MLKTNTARSPLLRPVTERDYTKGLIINEPPKPGPQPEPEPGPGGTGAAQQPGEGRKFNIPHEPAPGPGIKDDTREFTFDDKPNIDDDLGSGAGGDAAVQLSAMSAKAFASFAANAIKVYVPRFTGRLCKVDIEDVAFHVQKGKLPEQILPYFLGVNERTDEALKIPDDSIEMWKKACQAWLEYKNFAFANPETAFIAASIALGSEIAVAVYQCRKTNIELYRKALEDYNPEMFAGKKEPRIEPDNKKENGESKAA